jgi:putative acetyltransferase
LYFLARFSEASFEFRHLRFFAFIRAHSFMANRITIRNERADQPDVMQLLAELDQFLASLYPPEANHIMDMQALLAPEVAFLVARDAGRAVATGAFRRMPGEPATSGVAYGEIKRMMVHPEWRGQRLGTQLLGMLEAQMYAEGFRLALLETGREQAQAVRLYERNGYRERAPFGGYPDNGLSVFFGKTL